MSTSVSPGRASRARSADSSASSPASRRGLSRVEIDARVAALAAEPRVLDLGELERLRDELAERVAEARRALRERAGSRPRTATCSSG